MIVKKKIELTIEVEEICLDYVYEFIIDGMDFEEGEGILTYDLNPLNEEKWKK